MVYSKPCLNRTDSIITYLARYSHRIAISNQRLISMDKDQVKFRYKDYRKNKSGIMARHYAEFIRRFLMHILPKGLMRIRHYRLLSNRCRKTSLDIIRQVLAKPTALKDQSKKEASPVYPCPKCHKGHLVLIQRLNSVSPLSRLVPG